MFRILSVAVMAIGFFSASYAEEWEKLGTCTASFQKERDEVLVEHQGRFSAIQIRVPEGNLELFNLKVIFRNGEVFSPQTRHFFREGSRTPVIDLPGEARVIQKIQFFYQSAGRSGRAEIEIFGKRGQREDDDRYDDRHKYNDYHGQKWEKLGSRRVDFRTEREAIDVGYKEGFFTALRLEVQGGDLEMYSIHVIFNRGENFSPNIRREFKEGSRSHVIDLPGDKRIIKRVEFAYRSKHRRDPATINLFGKLAEKDDRHDGRRWEELGSRRVDFRTEREAIDVGRQEGFFTSLRFTVEDGDLEIYSIHVIFNRGENFSPNIRREFEEGSRSHVIDLPGDKRIIKRVEFAYRSKHRRDPATIRLFGSSATREDRDHRWDHKDKDYRDHRDNH